MIKARSFAVVRGISAGELINRVLDEVFDSSLVDAVLDDMPKASDAKRMGRRR